MTDPEYHRRRAEMEMERALKAEQPDEASRHLELARLHRVERERLAMGWRRPSSLARPAMHRTDKES